MDDTSRKVPHGRCFPFIEPSNLPGWFGSRSIDYYLINHSKFVKACWNTVGRSATRLMVQLRRAKMIFASDLLRERLDGNLLILTAKVGWQSRTVTKHVGNFFACAR
jgi:hypothetical protein